MGRKFVICFSELNDPMDQSYFRFEEQSQPWNFGDDQLMILDEDFLRSL